VYRAVELTCCGLSCSSCVFCPADIQAGQGLYFETLTKTWRVKNCDTNNYGVQNITYGLTPSPCRDCEYTADVSCSNLR
jgi:hypothetical protein